MNEEQSIYASGDAGYYSHHHGARYLHPSVSGFPFPALVELHESQHEILASFNRLDAIARLYAPLLDPFSLRGEQLPAELRQGVKAVLDAIIRNSVFVHEVFATYASFALFIVYYPREYEIARAQLSGFYAEALTAGESAFGKIEKKQKGYEISVAMKCAVMALNIPLNDKHLNLDATAQLAAHIGQHSPDRRFKHMLREIRPYWQPESIFYKRVNSQVAEQDLYLAIREQFPELEFTLISEDQEISSRVFERMRTYFSTRGFRFMEERYLSPQDPVTIRERFGASIKLPGLSEQSCKDLSLKSKDYYWGAPNHLLGDALICQLEGRYLFCNIWPIQETPNKVMCKYFGGNYQAQTDILPLDIHIEEDELFALLKRMPKVALLKMDERWFWDYKDKLLDCGQLPVMLLHDTKPSHICDVIEMIGQTEPVLIRVLGSEGESLLAGLAYAVTSKYLVMFPMSDLGARLLGVEVVRDSGNIRFAATQEEFTDATGIERYPFFELYLSTYTI